MKGLNKNLLFEEVSVERPVRRRLHRHLQHLHTFFQPRVSCAKPRGFKSLQRERERERGGGNMMIRTDLTTNQ